MVIRTEIWAGDDEREEDVAGGCEADYWHKKTLITQINMCWTEIATRGVNRIPLIFHVRFSTSFSLQ